MHINIGLFRYLVEIWYFYVYIYMYICKYEENKYRY